MHLKIKIAYKSFFSYKHFVQSQTHKKVGCVRLLLFNAVKA